MVHTVPTKGRISSVVGRAPKDPHKSKLVRRNILREADNIYPLCLEEKETDSHLLIHCRLVRPLWLIAMEAWSISMALPSDPSCLMSMWLQTPICGKFKRNVWKSYFFATIWVVWNSRNDIVLNGGGWDATSISRRIKLHVGIWMKLWLSTDQYHLEDIVRIFDHLPNLG